MLHRNVARRAAVLVLAAMFALPSAAAAAEPFVPGVTDSSTGVLRSLERRGLEPGDAETDSAASGFAFDDAAVAVAAAGVIASLAVIVAGGRRRRIIAATAIGARR
jgi:hypothetical protein